MSNDPFSCKTLTLPTNFEQPMTIASTRINQWIGIASTGHCKAAGTGLAWRKEVSEYVTAEVADDCGEVG